MNYLGFKDFKQRKDMCMLSFMKTALFQNIPNLDEGFFATHLFPMQIDKQEILFLQGDEGHHLYVLESGSLEIYVEHEQRRLVLGHQFAGEVVGELELVHPDHHRTASVRALEPCFLWRISRESFITIVHAYPEILLRIARMLAERLQQADRKLSYFAFLDARLRIANLLLDMEKNFGVKNSADGSTHIAWRTSQQRMAEMIGLNRESVSRTLTEFVRLGWIKLDGRTVIIQNQEELERLVSQSMLIAKGRLWHTDMAQLMFTDDKENDRLE